MTKPGKVPSERSFGLSVGGAGLVFGALWAWRGHHRAGAVATVVGVALVLGGLLAPSALRIPNRVWWRFATALGWINLRILLVVFFFLVLTPAGWLLRLFGKNPLRSSRAGTNWSVYAERRRASRHYEHLY